LELNVISTGSSNGDSVVPCPKHFSYKMFQTS
jgi:hypothetical protein